MVSEPTALRAPCRSPTGSPSNLAETTIRSGATRSALQHAVGGHAVGNLEQRLSRRLFPSCFVNQPLAVGFGAKQQPYRSAVVTNQPSLRQARADDHADGRDWIAPRIDLPHTKMPASSLPSSDRIASWANAARIRCRTFNLPAARPHAAKSFYHWFRAPARRSRSAKVLRKTRSSPINCRSTPGAAERPAARGRVEVEIVNGRAALVVEQQPPRSSGHVRAMPSANDEDVSDLAREGLIAPTAKWLCPKRRPVETSITSGAFRVRVTQVTEPVGHDVVAIRATHEAREEVELQRGEQRVVTTTDRGDDLPGLVDLDDGVPARPWSAVDTATCTPPDGVAPWCRRPCSPATGSARLR